jgi:cell fate regulator YaaT (PSP1 superfamily)
MDDDVLYEYFEDNEILKLEGAGRTEAEIEPEYTDLVYSIDGKALPPGTPVYQLRITCSNETVFAVYNGPELKPGTVVLVPARYGKDLARLSGKVCGRALSGISKITRIERVATDIDLEKERINKSKEEEAFKICKQKISDRNMEMKLISVHFLIEESKIIFFFTAENRVDFRELVKDLVAIFKTRIELRQIGIRDEARIAGGLGICGRSFCCHAISDKLKPVAIKMAKEQNLSLSSMKISGPCGRLLCCLAYEHGFYAEQRRAMPGEGTKIVSDGTLWKITEVNAVCGMISLSSEDGRLRRLSKDKFEKVDNHWVIRK